MSGIHADPIGHVAFFGNADHAFSLGAVQVEELERIAEAGIGAIVSRVMARQFYHRDLLAVIRLGLIGGGKPPAEAAQIVKTYGEDRPLEELALLAVDILTALWFGRDALDLAKIAAPAPDAEAAAP